MVHTLIIMSQLKTQITMTNLIDYIFALSIQVSSVNAYPEALWIWVSVYLINQWVDFDADDSALKWKLISVNGILIKLYLFVHFRPQL